jgi:hypothetical protein
LRSNHISLNASTWCRCGYTQDLYHIHILLIDIWSILRGCLQIWSIGLSQSIYFDRRFTWSVITLLRWTRPASDLPHEEFHLDDEVPSNARNIIVLGIQNNEFFVFGKWRISLLNVGDKCVDTYLASIDCKGIQNKVLGMSTWSSLIGSLINAIETKPIIAKWKSRA